MLEARTRRGIIELLLKANCEVDRCQDCLLPWQGCCSLDQRVFCKWSALYRQRGFCDEIFFRVGGRSDRNDWQTRLDSSKYANIQT